MRGTSSASREKQRGQTIKSRMSEIGGRRSGAITDLGSGHAIKTEVRCLKTEVGEILRAGAGDQRSKKTKGSDLHIDRIAGFVIV